MTRSPRAPRPEPPPWSTTTRPSGEVGSWSETSLGAASTASGRRVVLGLLGPGRVLDLVAVDSGVLGRLGLAELLDEAEREHDDGEDEKDEDQGAPAAGLHVGVVGRLVRGPHDQVGG